MHLLTDLRPKLGASVMDLRQFPKEYAVRVTQVLDRDGWKCRHCGMRSYLNVHHIVYRSEQGTDAMSNLVALCLFCHEGIHQGKMCIWAEDQFVGADGPLEFITALGWRPGQ